MEREFYTDDFENLLKENADQFKLSPSKKVWHGIYNDLHPGRRWPSAVMSLIFIFSLVIVGHLNTQQSQRNYFTNLQKAESQKNTRQENKSDKVSQKSIAIQTNKTVPSQSNKADEKLTGALASKNSKLSSTVKLTEEEKSFESTITTDEKNENIIINNKISYPENSINLTQSELPEQDVAKITLTSANIISPAAINDEFEKNNEPVDQNTLLNPESKTTHVPVLKVRRNSKVHWTYYLSPAVSHRTYSEQGNYANANFNNKLTQRPSAGLEAGVMMKYSLTKKLKFTSGFQTNYSAYTIQANNIHPVMATLFLNDRQNIPYIISSISFYGNGPGTAHLNLHNYSLQVSLPVGLEYNIAGDNDVQLNVAGSFQPLFVVANRAYMPSTDHRNYITQASLTRKWNMSTNVGTFVSFNSNKFNWQIGPQVHYQLFSSYSTDYQLREHFIDYGVRVGIGILK